MKRLLWLLVLITQFANAQKNKQKTVNNDNVIITSLQSTIGYLADDKLEGRRTGSAGEKLAYEFIRQQFETIGLKPMGDNGTYLKESLLVLLICLPSLTSNSCK